MWLKNNLTNLRWYVLTLFEGSFNNIHTFSCIIYLAHGLPFSEYITNTNCRLIRQRKKFMPIVKTVLGTKMNRFYSLINLFIMCACDLSKNLIKKKRKETPKRQTRLILRDTVTRTRHCINLHQRWINLGFMQDQIRGQIRGQILYGLPRNIKLGQAGRVF